ncbi:MAG: methyltransferase [Bacteroidota bacterium]|nr:methyltransferase [Bacteroidota bacterium]
MPNPYFSFKKFTIHQDRCTMKVCTDSCILGAWTTTHSRNAEKILDIGTGTGLLTLMTAQKSSAFIDAIESNREAATQARENIKASPWSDRVCLIEGDARNFLFTTRYDFIITNPPFYQSDLRSSNDKKNEAKHDESLILEELMKVICSCLKNDGAFSILLSFHRTGYFENLASLNGFYLTEKLTVKQTPEHSPFRSICLFRFQKPATVAYCELVIKDAIGKYTPEFTKLLEDYY